MEQYCGYMPSNSSCSNDKLYSVFVYLCNTITSRDCSARSKSTAWRQQFLILNSSGGNLPNNLKEHLWTDYKKFFNINSEIHYLNATLPNVNSGTLLFPNAEFEINSDDNQEMFDDNVVIDNNSENLKHANKMTGDYTDNNFRNKNSNGSSSIRMNNFLQQSSALDTNTEQFFYTARQLLNAQSFKVFYFLFFDLIL